MNHLKTKRQRQEKVLTGTEPRSFILSISGVLCLLSFVLFLTSCRRSTEPLVNNQNLELKVADVTCTEVWLSLKVKNDFIGQTLKLYRNDSLVINKDWNETDSLLVDRELEPSNTYSYRVRIEKDKKLLGKSNLLCATTMDTTGHNYSWQTFEFGGQKGSSAFYDVAIINENNIWAVGEIYTEDSYTYDSLGNWIEPYNAAHWDGEKWELKRILYKGGFWTINSVYAINNEDVWFEAFVKWNGKKFIELEIPEIMTGFGINKTWATSSDDFYAVGNKGQIRHYNGQSWQNIESGTELDIHDIWGKVDNTDKSLLLAPSCQIYQYSEKRLT